MSSACDPPERLLADARWLGAFVRRLSGDRHDAEDLRQDVLVAAWRAQRRDRPWLAAVARNLAASLVRRRRIASRAAPAGVRPDDDGSVADVVADAELQQRAVTAALGLPEPYRTTVLLRFLRGRSLDEVAGAMGVPVETVRTRQRRALAMLRAELAPRRRGGAELLGLLRFRETGTVLMGKKVMASFTAVIAILLAVWIAWPDSTVGRRTVAPNSAPVRTAAVQGASADAESSADAAVERSVVPETAASPPIGTPGALEIEVRWSDGEPGSGVPLRLRSSEFPAGWLATTDGQGHARFDGLRPGPHVLQSLHGDVYRQPAIEAGRTAREVLEIPLGLTVRGLVVDADGVAVPHAEIVAIQGGTEPTWVYPIGVCDAAGQFVVRGLAPLQLVGARSRSLGCSDLALITTFMRGDEPPRPLRLVLPEASATLRGRVVDEAGAPIPDAWVRVGQYGTLRRNGDGTTWQVQPGAITATDANGTFEVDMLAAAPQRLRVHARGLAPYDGEVDLTQRASADVVVTLDEGATLVGTVRDAAGAPLRTASVEVDELWFPVPTHVQVDAEGAYRLEGLPAGSSWTVVVSAPGVARAERALVFARGETVRWDVELTVGVALRGRLVDARGAPLVGWFVDSDRHERRARTGDDGRFVLPGCDAVAHRLDVRRTSGFVPVVTSFADLWPRDAEQELVVPDRAMPSARARGICVDPTGRPLSGIEIQLSQDRQIVLVDGQVLRTGTDGGFETPVLPPGRYELRPFHADLEFAAVPFELAVDAALDLGVLRAAGR